MIHGVCSDKWIYWTVYTGPVVMQFPVSLTHTQTVVATATSSLQSLWSGVRARTTEKTGAVASSSTDKELSMTETVGQPASKQSAVRTKAPTETYSAVSRSIRTETKVPGGSGVVPKSYDTRSNMSQRPCKGHIKTNTWNWKLGLSSAWRKTLLPDANKVSVSSEGFQVPAGWSGASLVHMAVGLRDTGKPAWRRQ
jgi:hypothetical protein